MTIDANKTFEVDNGVTIGAEGEGPFYTGGPSSPYGLDLPVRSLYNQVTTEGIRLWIKHDTRVNDWCVLSGSTFSLLEDSITIPENMTLSRSCPEIKLNKQIDLKGNLYILPV